MKRLIAFVLAFAATLTIAAATEAPAKEYSCHYDYKDFTGLAVSNAFNVELAFADTWSVDVTVPDFIEPYLKVSCAGGKVRIGLDKLPNSVQRKLNDLSHPLQAKVTMPKLLQLSLSGASKLSGTGTQVLDSENLHIEISGASQLKSFESEGNGTVNIDLSGASKADMKVLFDRMNVEVSGASSGEIDGKAQFADIDISGASKLKVNGTIDRLKLDVSGAAKYEGYGEAAKVDVELSGASKCRLTVTEQLYYELSGVSTLHVKNQGAQIDGELSRGSKIEFDR